MAGSCTGAGAAGARASPPAPFPVARRIPTGQGPCPCLSPARRGTPEPACPCLQGSWCPKPFAHTGCSAVAHISCCGTVKEGGSGLGCSHGRTSWGLGLGRAGDQAGHASQGPECNQGLYCGTSSNSGRERAGCGLLLGRAAPGEGSAVSWLQPAAFHPTPMGTTHRASICATAPSQGGGARGWSSPALAPIRAGR